MNDVDSKQFGAKGCVNETGTTAVTGSFYAIQIIETANFSLLTDATATGDAMTGFDIEPQILFGNFSAFTLASGKVKAYVK